MYWQQRYLQDTKTFGGLSGLDTIDLPNKGLLGGVELRVWGTMGDSAGDPDVWLHDRITKIELIVNGSQVVKSLTGEQLLADMLYKKTPIWSHDIKNMNAASGEEVFFINLGFHWHDLDYLLDLSRVNDPEIRITYNFEKTDANGWTNGVAMTAEPSRTVVCHLLRDAPGAPKGYIKTSELYRFTSGASKKENMTVPRGPVYSNLYLQSWYKAQGIGYLLDKIELNINSDDIIPISLHSHELAAQNLRQYGLFEIAQQMTVKGGQQYPCPIEQGTLANVRIGLNDAEASALDLWGNASPIGLRKTSDGVTPVTSNVNVQAVFTGIWPFSVAAIPYFNPEDPRTWIDSAKLGDLWVRVEENASGGTSAVLKLLGDEVVTVY